MNQTLRRGWTAVCLLVAFGMAQAEAADLYFIRHAQTMANVTREYTDENQRVFSPRGEEQIRAASEKLAEYDFDVVLVSPAWRTQHTILPYLKVRGMQAEIWPELYECCWDRETEEEEPELVPGPRIEVEEDVRRHFRFRDEDSVYMLDVDTPARGDLMVERAVELIRSRFAGTDQSVLIVSHYHTGSRLIPALLDEPPPRAVRPANARLSHVHQDDAGRFRLRMLNDRPIE